MEIEDDKPGGQNNDDIVSAYTLQAETYDAIDTEAFYINEYELYNKHLNILKPFIRGNVLDLGCGTGLQIPFLSKYAKTVSGIDITYPLLKKAQEKFPDKANILLIQADALNLPFPDSHFDYISSYGGMISHIKEYEKAFSEISRVIKPGGIIAFSVLNKWNLHLLYHPRELSKAILLKKTGQWRKWECAYSTDGERVSLYLKTFSFGELNTLLEKYYFEPISFMGVHILSLLIPLRFQYGMKVNFWGKLFRRLGKVDSTINTRFPFYKLGYTILMGAKSIK
ncbi:MAG: class I SAM-dependent methyltransferase [Candidatus Aminicenantes bacterium]|nr:class I SAM-dependent methyltransferase [Candidatus Aminicenantes bacterium]